MTVSMYSSAINFLHHVLRHEVMPIVDQRDGGRKAPGPLSPGPFPPRAHAMRPYKGGERGAERFVATCSLLRPLRRVALALLSCYTIRCFALSHRHERGRFMSIKA